MESDALNAFATGMNQKAICDHGDVRDCSTGSTTPRVESVLGHELTHIRNGDVRMMVVAVIIAGVVSFFAELFFRLWFYNGVASAVRDPPTSAAGGGAGLAILIAVALIVLAYLLSFIIRLALSRSREFLADAGSVELTKNPDAMISALRKIEGRGELPGATSAVMEMCIDNPRQGFGELFDTHPTVESRVAALVKFAGGHDPGPIALAAGWRERRGGPSERPRPTARGNHRPRADPGMRQPRRRRSRPAARRRRRTSTLPRHRRPWGRTATASAPSAKPAPAIRSAAAEPRAGQRRLGKSPARGAISVRASRRNGATMRRGRS